MKIERISKDEIKLVGLTCRTNNKNEFDPNTAKIGALVDKFWQEDLIQNIQQRIHPGVTFAVYTNYASD